MANPRKLKRRNGEGAQDAPSSSSAPKKTGGGIKKRTVVPAPKLAPVSTLQGEVGVVVAALNKDHGLAVPVIRASDTVYDAGFVGTGILSVDMGLGGGWRLSRGCMSYGERSAGKTTLALLTVVEMQRLMPDHMVAWVDVEGTFDKNWAKKLGVDLDRLLLALPDTGEDAVNIADSLARAREISMVVTDSIAMLSPQKEIDSEAEQDLPGLQARLVGKFLRKVNNAIIRERKRGHNPLIMHINQWRMKIGVMFGDPRTLPGGKALEFATTQQIEIKNKEHKESKGDEKGYVMYNEHTINVTKNKSGGPLREAMFKFIRTPHGGMPEGYVDQAKTVASVGLQSGVFSGAPSSFAHDTYGKWRGAPDYTKWSIENPIEARVINRQIIDYYRNKWGLDG